MMNDIVASITEDFQLRFDIPKLLRIKLSQIGPGKKVRVEIKLWRKKRTKKQNSYLWSVVYPMVVAYIKDVTGKTFTEEDLHEKYKKQYLGYETCDLVPDLIHVKSSKDLDTEEFWGQLVEHVCREWAEQGLYIPLPEKKADIRAYS